jgi:hypothetical protein
MTRAGRMCFAAGTRQVFPVTHRHSEIRCETELRKFDASLAPSDRLAQLPPARHLPHGTRSPYERRWARPPEPRRAGALCRRRQRDAERPGSEPSADDHGDGHAGGRGDHPGSLRWIIHGMRNLRPKWFHPSTATFACTRHLRTIACSSRCRVSTPPRDECRCRGLHPRWLSRGSSRTPAGFARRRKMRRKQALGRRLRDRQRPRCGLTSSLVSSMSAGSLR